ncbi:MAG: beta-galactosidase [Clostridia bacterium]|nr:beta-galactosidase [Clostridia bacterium]
MDNALNLERLTFGVCYYPEHWPETLWRSDLERMRVLGISVIRIAEFAWSLFEPREGEFTFAFFDRFLALVSEFPEIRVIFCTPTATPPAWLTDRYPEVLNADMAGTPFGHGMRRHCNYNAPVWRGKSRLIAQKLGEHYGRHPSIIGWQIDNELNCETDVFYAEADHAAFREFLKKKYGTLDALNEAWGNVFWNQTYTEWRQVRLSRYVGGRVGFNPHMRLDEKRFFSDSAVSYCRLQYEALRENVPEDRFITTNGIFSHLDYRALVGHAVDFICYDSYPNFGAGMIEGPGGDMADRKWSWNLANVRAYSPLFGVMEQQSGANGWTTRMAARAPLPGQLRLWTFQSVAHGADFVSWFRWRTATFGTEIYWHGLLDYDNRDNRKLAEAARTIREAALLPGLAGTPVRADVALLRDNDNLWDGEDDLWHGPMRRASESAWFAALQTTHTPYDIVYVDDRTTVEDLARYRLAVYPHASILSPERTAVLGSYVEAGGRLLLGARSGYKDLRGQCPMTPAPGPAAALCGATVREGSMVTPGDVPARMEWDGERLDAPLWNDVLEPDPAAGARVLAWYADGRFAGAPALTVNPYGQGEAYLCGTGFDVDGARAFLRRLGAGTPFRDLLELPAGCELAVRGDAEKRLFFILNYGEDTTVILKRLFTDRLTGEKLIGETRVERFGVRVLTTGNAEATL